MTKNDTQKKIIKTLTETHQNAAQAFKIAISQAETPEEAQTLRRIAQALAVKI